MIICGDVLEELKKIDACCLLSPNVVSYLHITEEQTEDGDDMWYSVDRTMFRRRQYSDLDYGEVSRYNANVDINE